MVVKVKVGVRTTVAAAVAEMAMRKKRRRKKGDDYECILSVISYMCMWPT